MFFRPYMAFPLISLVFGPATTLAANSVLKGPPPRAITDPRSIGSPSNPAAQPVPVADLFYTRSGLDAAWTPDGNDIVISTDITGRFNLWKLPATGGFPQQLTQSDDHQVGISISPDAKTVVFQSDHGGGEIYDLYSVPLAGGVVNNLTNSPDASETGAIFSPDGKWLAFGRRSRTAAQSDLMLMELATGKIDQLTHEQSASHSWKAIGFTENGRALIANRSTLDFKESAVYRLDIANGTAQALTKDGQGQFNSASAVSSDGKTIALTTETVAGVRQAALLDVATRTITSVKPDAWEQQSGRLSPNSRTFAFSNNEDGRIDIFTATGNDVRRVALPAGVNTLAATVGNSFSPDGQHLLVSHEASNEPFNYWVADLASGTLKPVTQLGLAGINPSILPAGQVVHYRSEDGTVISALLFVPFNLKRDGSAPGVVIPHGGPTWQTFDSFNRTALALASRGYVVIMPNPRGSTGFGRAFAEANHMDLGGGDLTDEIYGVKFMTATGYVNSKKIGITGESYGGYMTLMGIGKAPALWAAAVEEYGIINWFTMYESETPTLQQFQIGLMGDPVKNKIVYDAASPLTYIRRETAPLLVLHGENDIRVPIAQAKEVVGILKDMGRTVDAHYYPGEGHGFLKREDQIDSIERMVVWFDKYLKGS